MAPAGGPLRVLTVAAFHPALRPEAGPSAAHALHGALREVAGVRPMFLAGTGAAEREAHLGTTLQTPGRSADEVLVWAGACDGITLALDRAERPLHDVALLLETFRPDIVHVHDLRPLGLALLALVRRVVPRARLVVTLHDFLALCAHDGLLLTRPDRHACPGAAPDACRRCFPDTMRLAFTLRRVDVLAHFELVDRFLAPTARLRAAHVDWGLPAERVSVLAAGRDAAQVAARHVAVYKRLLA